MGGVLMLIACVLEFIIGNTLPGVAFGTYGMDRPVVLFVLALRR